PLPGHQNYLLGNNPAKWQTNVPTFRQVVYEAIYPRTNLVFYGNNRELEYDFQLAPSADPKVIQIVFEKNVRLDLANDGTLNVSLDGYKITQRKPVIYQEVAGEHCIIDGGYVLLDSHTIGFAVGDYDHTQPLVIDPTLVFSTYLGGTGDDSGS